MARPDEQDTTRRDFFRTFGRETVRQAGAVAGMAAELRRSSMAAARVIFDPDAATDAPALDPIDPPIVQVYPAQPDATFRSAYRFTGTALVALDARQLPGRVTTISLLQPSEIASAIRAGAINGGPVLAEVGAYAMALATRAVVERPDTGRLQQVRAAANTLRAAKPHIQALTWAVDRLEALAVELAGQGTDPTEMADRLKSEADSIASANTSANAEIGGIGAAAVLGLSDEPLNLLVHGDMGPLSCGMVGMGTALIQNLRDAGREVHVWLPEGGPDQEGRRITAFTLRQLDVPFTVVPDSALGWVFDGRRIDALVLRGDRVAANGDCVGPVGGLPAAVVAASAGVPAYVLAPLHAYGGDPFAISGSSNPIADVIHGTYITRVISEAAT